jgi:prolyl oligopeptidase
MRGALVGLAAVPLRGTFGGSRDPKSRVTLLGGRPAFRVGLLVALVACAGAPATEPAPPARAPVVLDYPEPPRQDVVEMLHGVEVADPFRPLEDVDAPATRRWLEAERRLSDRYLDALPARAAIRQRLTELHDFERLGLPERRGGRVFFVRQRGNQDQAVLYWSESLDAEPHVLVDPNTLAPDGTLALAGFEPSEDGRLVAFALSEAGSDWKEWRVREVATGLDLEDRVRWSKFSGAAWTHDGAGFFYSRYEADHPSDRQQRLYYHRLGEPQSEDALVYERPDHPEWGFRGRVSEDGRTLVIRVWQGTRRKNAILLKDLEHEDAPVLELPGAFEARYDFVGSDRDVFYFATDRRAPLGRVVAIERARPDPRHWREVIPEKRDVLQRATFVGDRFFVRYLRDASSRVTVYRENGEFERQVGLPGIGSVSGFEGRREDVETFYTFTSFTTPPRLLRYELETGESHVQAEPRSVFDPEPFATRQVFVESADGTRIPLFLVQRADLPADGRRPTYLTGYGGFGVPLTPRFSSEQALWLELGGVLAVANLRGGGEYGRAWHDAGRGRSKQNVFDDFLAVAEWLVESGITVPERLAIGGRSNGGLLVAAAMVQRPRLFGACVVGVGVLDMLRFPRFTVGWAWEPEYGSPDDPEDFAALLAYSPYHRLEPGTAYPATFVATADHDDRVHPAHSYKFAAALQAAQGGPAPVLLHVETRAGHGAGKPLSKRIEASADAWSFVVDSLGVDYSSIWRSTRSMDAS